MPARLAPDVAAPPLVVVREPAAQGAPSLRALPGGRTDASKPRARTTSRAHAALSRVPTLPLRLAL